jgi:hypothetical protein
VLLVTDQVVPNIQGALVQLGSRSWSTFFHFNADFPVNVVSLHHVDRLDGEPYLPGLPFWVLVYPRVGHRPLTVSPKKAPSFYRRLASGELTMVRRDRVWWLRVVRAMSAPD